MTIKEIKAKHPSIDLRWSGIMGGGKWCPHCKKDTSTERFSMGRWGRYVWVCTECGNY